MKVYDPEISESAHNIGYLSRYLDISRLLFIIQSGCLHFTRFDHFEDNLEGVTAWAALNWKSMKSRPLNKLDLHHDFSEEEKEKILKNSEIFQKELLENHANSQRSQFASCWFMGERESIAMWKIYSRTSGLMIKLNADELIKAVVRNAKSYQDEHFQEMYYGPITYKRLNPLDMDETFNSIFNGLKKDVSYEHEKEFRFVVAIPKSGLDIYSFFRLPIGKIQDFESLQIISSPFMPQWEWECICNFLKYYGLDQKFIKSKIDIK